MSEPIRLALSLHNIDGQAGKQGCVPADVPALAALVDGLPGLVMRGLMIIPTPWPDLEARRPAFRAARQLFDDLRVAHPNVDTLSMGMSDDLEAAIAEGSTLVRVGTAIFGSR